MQKTEITYEQQTVTIPLDNHSSKEVEMHIAVGTGLGYYGEDDFYHITHLPSGKRIAIWRGEEATKALIQRLASIANWMLSEQELATAYDQQTLKERVSEARVEIIQKYGNW